MLHRRTEVCWKHAENKRFRGERPKIICLGNRFKSNKFRATVLNVREEVGKV